MPLDESASGTQAPKNPMARGDGKAMLIYLPVETSRREMVSKIFTATLLAGRGYPVVVFKRDFFDVNGWPSPGLYIGKNCFRNSGFGDEQYYSRMKEEGVKVWHLDEEGGIYTGTSEESWRGILLKRLNTSALREDDKILTWGKWQRETFQELHPECPVCITGSPNLDMFNPIYSDSLADFDQAETDGRKDFILVNTRFSLSNGLLSIKRHLQDDSTVRQHVDPRTLRHWISQSGILQYSFVSMVQSLAEALPDVEIVLRPHPAEDPELYRDLLGGFANASVEWRGDVGSWIRRCRALIHNGCTTAVQAQIAGKPVITYLPVSEADELSPGLPNLIGEKCRTVKEVVAALERRAVTGDQEVLTRTVSTAGAIERIVDMVEAECAAPDGPGKINSLVAAVDKASRRGKQRDARKRLKRQLLPMLKKVNKNKGKKFDADFFARAPEVCAAASNYSGAEVDLLAPHPDVFLLVPRGRS